MTDLEKLLTHLGFINNGKWDDQTWTKNGFPDVITAYRENSTWFPRGHQGGPMHAYDLLGWYSDWEQKNQHLADTLKALEGAAIVKVDDFVPNPRMPTVIRDPDPERSFREANPDLFDGTMRKKIREIL